MKYVRTPYLKRSFEVWYEVVQVEIYIMDIRH